MHIALMLRRRRAHVASLLATRVINNELGKWSRLRDARQGLVYWLALFEHFSPDPSEMRANSEALMAHYLHAEGQFLLTT